ncbi:MAG: DEAD/DEAH box helicase [Deltaproteobacteria bacterium]|nr:DEAD/DEAH box helicase [Deltaproteobacteria bacterium]
MTIENLVSRLPVNRIEYLRNAVALVPEKDDSDPGLAVLVMDAQKETHNLQCNCRKASKKGNCLHIRQLSKAARGSKVMSIGSWVDDIFRKSPWYRMAAALHKACPFEPATLKVEDKSGGSKQSEGICILRPDGELLIDYHPDGAASDTGIDEAALFCERTLLDPAADNPFHRGRVLEMLSILTMTDSERIMQKQGIKTRRQSLEESFWYRLAYHFWNVSPGNGASMTARVDEETGRFIVRLCTGKSLNIDIAVPRKAVMQVRREIEKDFSDKKAIEFRPESLESIVKVTADDHNNLNLDLYLLLYLSDGSTMALERRGLEKYWYGNTVYIPQKGVLASWKKPDRFREMFGGLYSKRIKPERLPEVIEKLGDIFSSPNIIDDSVSRLKIHREYARIEINPGAMDNEWCWLSVNYGFAENITVSLAEIYAARLSGRRYLPVEDGWVDARAINMDALICQPGGSISKQLAEGSEKFRLSRSGLLRLQASFDKPVSVKDSGKDSGNADGRQLESILAMRPPEPIAQLSGMSSTLRQYQQHGAEWLAFLHANRLGGLLCDEMGLGKTHQIMALMVWLCENEKKSQLFLVVCPTTVISHWERKIRDHAPSLLPLVYHGVDRELNDTMASGTVLITSYGILFRDIDRLAGFGFSMAAFDEAQYIKNPDTRAHAAARRIRAGLKVAVTGTPIENRLGDLKALMDLALPGYLGGDSEFKLRYECGEKSRLAELRRLVSPFALRRTKAAVLDELPEKIEDIRYCRLTDTQVKLYREAIAGRGRGLLKQLERFDVDIPYIHIFALLTLLKQICNHPASIKGEKMEADPGLLDSGKWELFKELMDTCLENGRKVVVFSQFVTMVNMILNYLGEKGIQSACITGQTKKRGNEIDRFNNDPDCRVFVGSLKAGGSGIDLIGGSVVIHYDRWWNAAKEDQATDRVHRIGQTRGVQVFKLVTEGTLEEKISAIIDRKKKLMANVIAEDEGGSLKTFTRDELMELIAMPV